MPRQKTLTKAQRIHMHNLGMMVFAMRDKVYAAAPSQDTPFGQCLAACDASIKNAYADALGALADFEQQMIAEGRGYRAHGLFFAY